MFLGHFVLETFANSDRSKAMYKQLPLSFNDNGELQCPGFKFNLMKGQNMDILKNYLLQIFGTTPMTRFQEDPAREDNCIFYWTCTAFDTRSTALRDYCPFPEVFEPSKAKCVFYTDAETKCNQYYSPFGEMAADEEFELKKTYLSRSKRGADLKSNLSWFDREKAVKDYIDDLSNEYSRYFSKFDLLIEDDGEFWKKMNSHDFWKKMNSQDLG